MPPTNRAPITDDAITVTTATQTEAEVRENLGEPAAKAAAPAAADAAGDDAKVKALEAEADSDKPDAALSEAGRTLRMSRGDARKKKIQDEINELVGTREKTREEIARLQKLHDDLKKDTPPPAERKPAADAAKPNADGKDSAAPKFEFPTFDQWQVDHPDAEWPEYTDARSDARYAFNREIERAAERATADEIAIKEAFTRAEQFQDTFKKDHPDYEAKLASLDLAKYGVVVENGQIVGAPPQWVGLQRLLMRSGEAGPQVLYFLADHPEYVDRMLSPTTSPADLLEVWGEVKYAAKASATATPKPAEAAAAAAEPAAPVAQPRTSAPAPMAEVKGNSSVTRSPHELAEGSDDADDYIAAREPRLLKRAGARG